MNTSLLVGLMFACGIFNAIIPFLCFIIASTIMMLNIQSWEVIIPMYLIVIVVTFGLAMGSFAFLQYDNCKNIKMKQVASNAGIATAIQAGTLALTLVPGFLGIPKNVLPLFIPYTLREGLSYGYFTFFASMFGTVIGGTFSSIC